MSAFMCTKTHIGTLAAYYARSGYDPMKMEDIYHDTFKIFDHENAFAVDQYQQAVLAQVP